MPEPVLTKHDFVRRYSVGEFGNASPTWNTYEEWMKDLPWKRYGLLYHIRNRIASGQTWYNVSAFVMREQWAEACQAVKADNLYLSAMAPTEQTMFQGEVQQHLKGLALYYTTVRKPMRDALATNARQVYGIMAVTLLRHYLCPKSYEWLQYLLGAYPHHVVEFSTYAFNWGTVRGMNTVFWEIRRY